MQLLVVGNKYKLNKRTIRKSGTHALHFAMWKRTMKKTMHIFVLTDTTIPHHKTCWAFQTQFSAPLGRHVIYILSLSVQIKTKLTEKLNLNSKLTYVKRRSTYSPTAKNVTNMKILPLCFYLLLVRINNYFHTYVYGQINFILFPIRPHAF